MTEFHKKYNAMKTHQLGMSHTCATRKLSRKLIWKFIVETEINMCFHCNKLMALENYSLEHKLPWLHSNNALDLFLDLNNVTFSHLTCNIKAARTPRSERTHCPQGHPYSGDNLLPARNTKHGKIYRRCRICTRKTNKKCYHKKQTLKKGV